jgi:hypothetical protein
LHLMILADLFQSLARSLRLATDFRCGKPLPLSGLVELNFTNYLDRMLGSP